MVGEVALAVMLAGATPAAACTPKLDVTVDAEHRPPTVRSSYALDEIRALAQRAGRPLRHEAFGFYVSTFGYKIDVDHRTTPGSECGTVIARVRLVLGGRLIEVAKDLEARSCQREVIVAHYKLHAKNDDKALSVYASRAYEAFKTKPVDDVLGDRDQGNVRDTATAAIGRIMDEVLESFDQDRSNALAAADNEEELQKLSSACIRAL